MHGTTAQRHCRPHAEDVPYTSGPYWGWSHHHQRMEFMDLPTYMDSFRQGYDAAYGDLLTRVQQLGWPTGAASPSIGWPAGAVPGPVSTSASPAAWGSGSSGPSPGWPGHHHRHRHHKHEGHWGEHHGHERRGCGCDCDCEGEHDRERDGRGRHDRDCDGCEHYHRGGHARCKDHKDRCHCCIVDADIIVYGHCGEVRVVPIEITNDSRKVRENVDVQVSDVRSDGGKVLAWPTLIQPKGPLTLEPCRTTRLELLVHIACSSESGEAGQNASSAAQDAPAAQNVSAARGAPAAKGAAAAKGAPATEDAPADQDAPQGALATVAAQRDPSLDVGRCEVGYTTIRLEGCLVRPIVVAIAALPLRCESYRIGCSCSCC